MRNRVRMYVLVLVLCVGSVLFAHEAAPGGGTATTTGPYGLWMQTILRFDPGVAPCQGGIQTMRWTTPQAMLIRSTVLWIGTTWRTGDVIDTWATMSLSDGFVLAFLGLDHYAAFTGLHQVEKVFQPPVPLAAGQAIQLAHYCQSYAGAAESAAFAIVSWTVP